MALPASVLERLGSALAKAGVYVPSADGPRSQGLPFGIQSLDAALPDGGLLRGGVVELALAEPGALGTSLSLLGCRAVQEEAKARGATTPWCAFVDPSSTLYAPGVFGTGVELERLLVVRPPLEALSRVAIKLVESPAFALVVIDTLGIPGAQVDAALGTWPRVIRRLSMAIEGTGRCVLLLTDAARQRPLPLPVAQRLELRRSGIEQLSLRVVKDRKGRIGPARSIVWARAGASSVSPERREHGLKIA